MSTEKCHVFWGSHGCDLENGHDGQHLCKECCWTMEHHLIDGHVTAPDGYGFDGCAGSWPYYGRKNMAGKTEHGLGFFEYRAPEWKFVYLPDEFDRLEALR